MSGILEGVKVVEMGNNIAIPAAGAIMGDWGADVIKVEPFDYATLNKINPRLIYAVLTGYGSVGPDKDERGFDFTAGWARSGTQHLMAENDGTPPAQRAGMYDRTTGMHTVAGVCAALFHREKTGQGQEIELSLYHVGVYTIGTDIQNALMGLPSVPNNRRKANSPLWNSYRAGDDRWFQFAMLQADVHWPGLCRAMERPDLESDVRFNTTPKRTDNAEELIRIMDTLFSLRPRSDWEKRFKDNGVIYGRIETPQEVVNDPQAHANGFFTEIDHPRTGKMKYVTTPVDFRQNPASIRTPAPEVGQHNEEILLGLGYSWDNISSLKEQQVIL